MGTTDVGEEELASAKRLAVGTYLFQNQIQGAVVGTLANNWLMGLPPDYLANYVPKVNAVTAPQVREVSRKYFAAKDQTIVVVGDKAKIAGDLAQFAEVRSGGSYLSQNDLRLHFGLGAHTGIDRVEITWPGGARQVETDVASDRVTVIRQR